MRFRPRAALAFLLSTACADEEAGLPVEPAPEALFGGCDEFSGSVCTLEEPSKITAWLDVHGATPLLVRIDGENVPSTGRIIQGGVRLEFDVPAGASKVEIETTEASWEPPIELSLVWESVPDLGRMPIEELEALAKESTGWVQLRTTDLLRRKLRQSKRFPEFRKRELKLARELGAEQHEISTLGSEAHALIEANDFEGAETVLSQLHELSEASPLAEARWRYYSGLMAQKQGDLKLALTHLQRAHTLHEELNVGVEHVIEVESAVLSELGRDAEARALLEMRLDTLDEQTPQCGELIRIINNIAWVQTTLASLGRDHQDPRPLLLDAFETGATCPSPYNGYIILNLAMIELEYGNPSEALYWLSRLDTQDQSLTAWADEVHARAAWDSGRMAEVPPLVSRPVHSDEAVVVWNQTVRIADNLAAWGFDELASVHYQSAETQLAESFERVGSGGELYLSGRSASLEGLVPTLVRLGRLDAASCAIRLARVRELGRLDRTRRLSDASQTERDAWERQRQQLVLARDELASERAQFWGLSAPEREKATLRARQAERVALRDLDDAVRGLGLEPTPRACDELRPPKEGEVILVPFSSDEGQWIFASSTGGVEVTRSGDLSSLESLGAADRFSIIDTGMWSGPPVHTTRWRGFESILDIAPVEYSLDLPRGERSNADHHSALVVADTRSDLPSANIEADAVVSTLQSKGWTVVDLRGSEATRAAVLDRAKDVDVLHYAGHGVRDGISGWDSALLLAGSERLEVPDVLTLPTVPRGLVLTGCETGAAAPDTVAGGVNIGRAFILSGSDWVIAADAEVDDEAASRVGALVHRSPELDGATRLRQALLELRDEDPEGPWEHFRVIVP